MLINMLEWTDRAGVTHPLQLARDLSAAERQQLNLMRQQFQLSVIVLDVGYRAPVIEQARPNMMRMMLRILLSNVENEEIATFDLTTGNDLLTQWWAVTDAVEPTHARAR
jgi:hypothetical protein